MIRSKKRKIDQKILERILLWLVEPSCDESSKEAVRELFSDPNKLVDAFSSDLTFGTGGIRGLLGVGPNRINIYTVRRTAHGLAKYMIQHGDPNKGVVVGFDNRLHSKLFAEQIAEILSSYRIRVFKFQEIRATPYISFSCRYLKAEAAVMITASHNPKEYNGYKIYWNDGAQIVAPHDKGIIDAIKTVPLFYEKKGVDQKNSDYITLISESIMDEAYLKEIASLKLLEYKDRFPIKISYTSLHGAGIPLMTKMLGRLGFTHLNVVQAQADYDPHFSTLASPNPEDPETLSLGIKELIESDGDILLATDPDADRISVAVRRENRVTICTGNELAAIGAYFICNKLKKEKQFPPNGAIISTLVTTKLVGKIAAHFGATYFEVLPGFKHIAAQMRKWEENSEDYSLLFAAENSHGYLIGTHARDKDGIAAGALFAQIAATLYPKTMIDWLCEEIYPIFGIDRETEFLIDFVDKGREKVGEVMRLLRKGSGYLFEKEKISLSYDYLTAENGMAADILLFRAPHQSKIIVRPSGTENKIKIYASTSLDKYGSIKEGISFCNEWLEQLVRCFVDLLPT